jgi:hypothetical protein
VHDVLELGMTGHGNTRALGGFRAGYIGRKNRLVIPGRAKGANPESRNNLGAYVWIPDRR